MTKVILIAVALLVNLAAFAQEEPAPPRTPRTPEALSKITTSWNVYSGQWLDAPDGITVRPVSLGTSLYVHFKIPLYGQNITFMVGPGVSYTDFHTNGTPAYRLDTGGRLDPDTTLLVQLQPKDYTKNKMSLVHLELPVELQFAFNTKDGGKGFHITPGFATGVLVNDYMKRVWEDEHGDKRKAKDYYTRNLSKFSYGPSLRIGYKWIGVYGFYGLSPLFEDGKGPEMTYYKVGLTIGGI